MVLLQDMVLVRAKNCPVHAFQGLPHPVLKSKFRVSQQCVQSVLVTLILVAHLHCKSFSGGLTSMSSCIFRWAHFNVKLHFFDTLTCIVVLIKFNQELCEII